MEEIQLKLTLSEVNLILGALGEMPYAKVYQLVGKIQQQAETQLQPTQLDQSENQASEP